MRVLFTIPHYFLPSGNLTEGRPHGSYIADPKPRVQALTACLSALHQLFNSKPCFIHHGKRLAYHVEPATPCSLDIVICTTDGRHLLDQLPILPHYYSHQPTDADPLSL